jgi:hypothetical protein
MAPSSSTTTHRLHFNVQNEKRKDKEVTARVEHIFKLRDQAMKGVDMGARTMYSLTLSAGDEPPCIGKVEQNVDHLVRVFYHTIVRSTRV